MSVELKNMFPNPLKQKPKVCGTIAFDFDGVVHQYSCGWQDGSIYDPANRAVIRLMTTLMDKDYAVYIHSTRRPRQIKRWLTDANRCEVIDFDEYAGGAMNAYEVQVIHWWTRFWQKRNVLGITRRKLPALLYVDDRSVRWQSNWSIVPLFSALQHYEEIMFTEAEKQYIQMKG